MIRKSTSFVAATLWTALCLAACSSDDASLGSNRGATNPGEGSAGSGDAGSTAGKGSAGSGNSGGSSSAGSSNGGSTSSGGSNGGGAGAGAAGSGGSGGSGVPDCETIQCARAIECVETCGGPVIKSGCCPCDPGTFDDIQCTVPAGLNEDCVDDACPASLTPVHFYGVAGPPSPEFCWCTIPCEDDPDVCPSGTSCVTISDGPGMVCSD